MKQKVRFDEVFRPEHMKKMMDLFQECLDGKTTYPFRNHLIDELLIPQWPVIKHDLGEFGLALDIQDLSLFLEQLTYRLYYGRKGALGQYFSVEEKLRLAAYFFYQDETEDTGETVEDFMMDMKIGATPAFMDTVFYSGLEPLVIEYTEEMRNKE